ncbi:MAG: hypothetical protein JSV88_20940 [Candidatus Aminicenantes bacterium]|nr:MAG: hypothetical protein JSV88_20940 [Candidatus Aminicenantes bacterium]
MKTFFSCAININEDRIMYSPIVKIIIYVVWVILGLFTIRKTRWGNGHRLLTSAQIEKKFGVQGQTLHRWDIIPSLIKRIFILSFLFLPLAAVVVVIVLEVKISYEIPFICILVIYIFFDELVKKNSPRKYRITEQGLWCCCCHLFLFEKSNDSLDNLFIYVKWEEVCGLETLPGKIVLYHQLPQRKGIFHSPIFRLRRLKKIEVLLPVRAEESLPIEETIKELYVSYLKRNRKGVNA